MGAHSHLSATLVAEVETLLHNPFDYQPITPERDLDWITHNLRQAPRLWDFILHRSAVTPDPGWLDPDLGLPSLEPGKPLIEQVQTAMERVSALCEFDPECTEPTPRLETFVESRCGSSADFPHLLTTLMRAWTEVLMPGAGWRGFDPVEGLVVNDTYVHVAVGRDAGDTVKERSALKGDGAEPKRRFLVKVSRK